MGKAIPKCTGTTNVRDLGEVFRRLKSRCERSRYPGTQTHWILVGIFVMFNALNSCCTVDPQDTTVV